MGCTGSKEDVLRNLPDYDLHDPSVSCTGPKCNEAENGLKVMSASPSSKESKESKRHLTSKDSVAIHGGNSPASTSKPSPRSPRPAPSAGEPPESGIQPLNSLDPNQMQQLLMMFNQSSMENQDPRIHKVSRSFNSLKQHYDVEDTTLGSGISGDVRLGKGKVTGRKVAIKTLQFEESMDDNVRLRLLNEIFIYLSVDHPNIVRLYDVYIGRDEINLVMEYAAGGELYKNLLQRKSYNERVAADLVSQMLSALVYLHQENICHRDLKLENWVYATKEPDSKIRLIDFGFARVFNSTNPMRAPLGSIYYVSPEILSMKPYDEKTDMWSLGVIVYMMLSGRPPFLAEKDFQTLSLIKKAKVEFPEEGWNRISCSAKDFVRKLLEKNPSKRLSAQEAMNHPWILKSMDLNDGKVYDSDDIDLMVSRMRDYTLRTEAYRHAANYIAKRVPNRTLKRIDTVFSNFDKSSTGVIELEDWLAAMQQIDVDQEEAKTLFDSIDVNGTGHISYSAFIASMNCLNSLNDDTLKASFQRLSIDPKRSEYLIEEDFLRRFGEEHGNQIFREIAACSKHAKGDDLSDIKITFSKFRMFMKTGGLMTENEAVKKPDENENENENEEDESFDMEAAKERQLCWDNLADACRNICFDRDGSSPVPNGHICSPNRMTPNHQQFPTFHLARGHSF